MHKDSYGNIMEIGDYVKHGSYSINEDLMWGKIIGFDGHYVLVKGTTRTIHKFYWNVTKLDGAELSIFLLKQKEAL